MYGAPVKPPGPPSESRSGSSTRQSPVQHLRLHRAGQVQPVRERPVEFLVREGAHLFHHLYHLWLLGIGSVRQRDSQIGQLPLYQADPLLNAGISLSGTGQAATEPFELESGLAVFRIAHQGTEVLLFTFLIRTVRESVRAWQTRLGPLVVRRQFKFLQTVLTSYR
jgi:hypothetical protein